MSSLQFWIFIFLLVFIFLRGFAKPQRFMEYPYFMAATFAVFIFPQVISLQRFPGSAPIESLTPVMLMTNLCLAACYFGYLLPPSRWIAKHGSTPVRLDRLFQAGVVFIAISYFFNFLISRMSIEETGGTLWTGRVTIYHFFTQLIYPGLSICLFNALARKSVIAWFFSCVAATIPLQAIIFAGRREGAALFVLTIGLTYFYQKRIIPPRLAIAAALGFAMLAIPATGTYRGAMSRGDFNAAKQIDLLSNFQRFLNEESILELRNAAVIIYTTSYHRNFEYGAAYWDQLIFRFVPAQLVGAELKKSLMFKEPEAESEEADEIEIGARSFSPPKGSTITGMADSFQQFGYFGCLFFALLAVIFRSLWETSLQPGAFYAKLLYIGTSTSAMRAVTHQTVDYLPGLLYNLFFIGLAVLYARQSGRTTKRLPIPAVRPPVNSTPSDEPDQITNNPASDDSADLLPLPKRSPKPDPFENW